MRIVVDTNVLISAIISTDSVPALAVDLVFRHHKFLSSLDTQDELQRVLNKPRFSRYLTTRAKDWFTMIRTEADFIVITDHVIACRDPKDDKFLELAVDGKADIIISGDKDLLSMTSYRNTRIITPAEFMNTLHA